MNRGHYRPSRGIQIVPSGEMDAGDIGMTVGAVAIGAGVGAGLMYLAHKYGWLGMGRPATTQAPATQPPATQAPATQPPAATPPPAAQGSNPAGFAMPMRGGVRPY